MSDWANLKTDILEAIAKRLSVEDYIRAQAVCRLWQLVLKDTPLKPKPHHHLPWLMLPEVDSNICRFYSFFDKKVRAKELPELRGRRCCGSSCGWMVMVDKSPDVFLLNPITRSQIQLPPITTFPGISELGREEYLYRNHLGNEERRGGEFMKYCFFDKVTVTGNPSSSGGYMVMGIYGDWGHLAFCREGDERWTLVHPQYVLAFFCDVVSWKGKFYAVDSDGVLVVCDLEGPIPKLRKIFTPQPAITGDKNYLVVSGDELLLVSRRIKSYFFNVNDISCPGFNIDENADHANSHNYNFIEDEDDDNGRLVDDNDNNNEDEDIVDGVDDNDHNNEDEDDDNEDGVDDNDHNNEDVDDDNGDGVDDNNYNNEDGDDGGEVHLYKTIKFKVFEFDEEGLTWTKVTSLQNRMLFVGNNFALSLCANDFPQCKANHIYFTDDCKNGHMSYIMGATTVLASGYDLGAYDMKNGKIERFPCCPEVTWLIWPPPFWATLSPC